MQVIHMEFNKNKLTISVIISVVNLSINDSRSTSGHALVPRYQRILSKVHHLRYLRT